MRLPFALIAFTICAGTTASAGPPPPIQLSERSPTADMPVFRPGPLASEAKDCPPTSRYHAVKKSGQRPEARKLVELPMADMYASVYRRIGRCEAPVIVRYGIGGAQR